MTIPSLLGLVDNDPPLHLLGVYRTLVVDLAGLVERHRHVLSDRQFLGHIAAVEQMHVGREVIVVAPHDFFPRVDADRDRLELVALGQVHLRGGDGLLVDLEGRFRATLARLGLQLTERSKNSTSASPTI
jgi:hypothetical protein